MLKNAANMLNFTYTIENPPDGSWGHIKEDASWNGLVYHASQDIVDFVICDVFIVFGRSQVSIFNKLDIVYFLRALLSIINL